MRLLNEVLDAVCAQWPAERVGVRLTPRTVSTRCRAPTRRATSSTSWGS
ncbi:hypothetical protein N8I87_42040 [Streptomyces sp. HUAS TT20]|nr:hypothetical protein N8I87_42040 [Streptomyces sp. HUAS 15-9]